MFHIVKSSFNDQFISLYVSLDSKFNCTRTKKTPRLRTIICAWQEVLAHVVFEPKILVAAINISKFKKNVHHHHQVQGTRNRCFRLQRQDPTP